MKSRFELPFPALRLAAWCLMKTGFRLEIRGAENLRDISGPVILAGNHTGYLDSLILLACIKHPFKFLMAEEVFQWNVVGKIVRYGNILPIDPDKPRNSLNSALKHLKNSHSVCIFPEGKLSPDGELGEFQKGVAFLQEKSGASILPFAISGGFEAWPYGQQWPTFRKIIVSWGNPLPATSESTRAETTRRLREEILAMLKASEQGDARHLQMINHFSS